LDTPSAIAALVEMGDRIRSASETKNVVAAQQTFRDLGGILGLAI
jgi:hypothetical protein